MAKQWFIYTESGECVEVETREEAIGRLQRFYTEELGPTNVLTEEEYETGRSLGSW